MHEENSTLQFLLVGTGITSDLPLLGGRARESFFGFRTSNFSVCSGIFELL